MFNFSLLKFQGYFAYTIKKIFHLTLGVLLQYLEKVLKLNMLPITNFNYFLHMSPLLRHHVCRYLAT